MRVDCLQFKDWLLATEMGLSGGANVDINQEIKSKVKNAILQQSGQKGADIAQVASKSLQQAGQEVTKNPGADLKTAVEIGAALDKAKQSDNKMMMKKKMGKR